VATRKHDPKRYLAGDVPEPLEMPKSDERLPHKPALAMAAVAGNGKVHGAPVTPVRTSAGPVNGTVAKSSGNGARQRRRSDNPLPTGNLARGRRRMRAVERRRAERRSRQVPMPFPDRRLTRSAYEKVFLKLVSGGRLRIGSETYTPIGMIGWDQAVFRRDSDGKRRLLSIDQLLRKMNDWK
jgi:hypothetical protein